MIKYFCDKCKKEVQQMELAKIEFSNFYIKPPFQIYELCGQCQMDMVKNLTGMELVGEYGKMFDKKKNEWVKPKSKFDNVN